MTVAPTLVTFSSDYGLADPFVGVCHLVIARLAPQARVVDLTHGIARQDVRAGALTLADCAPYLPPGVHLAVVDPGVGTTRRGIAVRAGEHLLVGPDNGLLLPAAERLGGADGAWELADPAYQLPAVSATFHGRDVFAPAAAHLANGVEPGALGPALPAEQLVAMELPAPELGEAWLRAEVVTVDRFGNAALHALGKDLHACGLARGDSVTVHAGSTTVAATLVATFAEVARGRLAVLVDSFGRVALAANGDSAAAQLGVTPGSTVAISR